MLRALEHRFFQRQIARGQMKEDEVELYRYAYSLLLMQAVNLLAAVVIGICFRAFSFLALFLLAFIPLRSFAGGYHAGTPLRCSVLSALMELGAAALYHFGWPTGLGDSLWLAAWGSGILIWLMAPLEARNKPLDAVERKRYGMGARLLLTAELAGMSAGVAAGCARMAAAIASALVLEAALLILGKIDQTWGNE